MGIWSRELESNQCIQGYSWVELQAEAQGSETDSIASKTYASAGQNELRS